MIDFESGIALKPHPQPTHLWFLSRVLPVILLCSISLFAIMHTLSFISVLLAASVAVAEHGVGVTRTVGHAKNAARFAQGLPPLPPANLKRPTSKLDQKLKCAPGYDC